MLSCFLRKLNHSGWNLSFPLEETNLKPASENCSTKITLIKTSPEVLLCHGMGWHFFPFYFHLWKILFLQLRCDDCEETHTIVNKEELICYFISFVIILTYYNCLSYKCGVLWLTEHITNTLLLLKGGLKCYNFPKS